MLQTTRNSTDQLFRRLGATSILLPSYYLIENGREKCLSKDVNVGGHVLMFSYIKNESFLQLSVHRWPFWTWKEVLSFHSTFKSLISKDQGKCYFSIYDLLVSFAAG